MIEALLAEIDSLWPTVAEPVRLSIIGSGALLLLTDFRRGTKDGDILETAELEAATRARLLSVAGRGSEVHKRRKIFIEVVPHALPFLPQVPIWHPAEINARLANLEIHALDVVDVVVSKLVPFRPNDRLDIEAMIDRGLVSHDRLLDRFRAAMDYLLGDAREVDLPRYIANLHTVERDILGVDETEIELPSWI